MSGKPSTSITGRRAEKVAQDYLEKHGLKTIAVNFRCTVGEIDLIMRDRREIVFVEVRARAANAWVSALESIDRRKQRRLRAVAELFLSSGNFRELPFCRFDAVLITSHLKQNQVQWIKDAF